MMISKINAIIMIRSDVSIAGDLILFMFWGSLVSMQKRYLFIIIHWGSYVQRGDAARSGVLTQRDQECTARCMRHSAMYRRHSALYLYHDVLVSLSSCITPCRCHVVPFAALWRYPSADTVFVFSRKEPVLEKKQLHIPK